MLTDAINSKGYRVVKKPVTLQKLTVTNARKRSGKPLETIGTYSSKSNVLAGRRAYKNHCGYKVKTAQGIAITGFKLGKNTPRLDTMVKTHKIHSGK